MKDYLKLSTDAARDMHKELRNGKTIAAIKIVRNATTCGLKEAKWAVERYRHEKLGEPIPVNSNAMRIISGPKIIKLVLDYGDGPLEIDLEGMQLRALTELHTIGVSACADALELIDLLKAVEEGKSIIRIEENSTDKLVTGTTS